MTPTYDIMN